MDSQLSIKEVQHVAKLAQLRLSDEQLVQYQDQLSKVLKHIAKLSELNVEGVEPMAHPSDFTNRLDEDHTVDSFPQSAVLSLAPEIEGVFLAVPKVLPGSSEDA